MKGHVCYKIKLVLFDKRSKLFGLASYVFLKPPSFFHSYPVLVYYEYITGDVSKYDFNL